VWPRAKFQSPPKAMVCATRNPSPLRLPVGNYDLNRQSSELTTTGPSSARRLDPSNDVENTCAKHIKYLVIIVSRLGRETCREVRPEATVVRRVEQLAYNSAALVPSSTRASPLGEGSTPPLRVEDVLVDDNDGRSDGSAVDSSRLAQNSRLRSQGRVQQGQQDHRVVGK
jgi:hypothetical protein